MSSISVVINTLNNAQTLENTLKSIHSMGEIIVVDMHSEDETIEIAKKYHATICLHERTGYVEPARNYAVSKATKEWVFVIDSDEEIKPELVHILKDISTGKRDDGRYTHYYFPRKNIVFGSWLRHSGWWPDEKMRFFKKGTVNWKDEIHSEPDTRGEGHHFPHEETYAIIHHHYETISQWVLRMDRYSSVQAKELHHSGYTFDWRDLIRKPLSEFLTRFFVWHGWKDGVLGLALSLMQALSFVIVYLKVWELEGKTAPLYRENKQFLEEVGHEIDKAEAETGFWLEKVGLQTALKRWIQKVLP